VADGECDARTARAALANGVLTIRTPGRATRRGQRRIATDGPALDPLTRNQIFATAFRRFADSAKSQRLERRDPRIRAAQLQNRS